MEMLIDSPYVGDWMGSIYSSTGRREDLVLFLNPDGTVERRTRREPSFERVDHGHWHHKEGEETMSLEFMTPDERDQISSRWEVLSIKSCEDSNCLMVLRWIALASRNLPIVFYRVHLPGRWYSERLGIHE